MKDRVIDILILIMSQIRGSKPMSDIDLGDLRQRGYSQSEISAALTWLHENMQVTESGLVRPAGSGHGSRRLLHDVERQVITTEGYGYLIQLRELGLLNDTEFELVVERAMLSGVETLSPADVRDIVAAVLLSRGRDAGPGFMHEGGDTIH